MLNYVEIVSVSIVYIAVSIVHIAVSSSIIEDLQGTINFTTFTMEISSGI